MKTKNQNQVKASRVNQFEIPANKLEVLMDAVLLLEAYLSLVSSNMPDSVADKENWHTAKNELIQTITELGHLIPKNAGVRTSSNIKYPVTHLAVVHDAIFLLNAYREVVTQISSEVGVMPEGLFWKARMFRITDIRDELIELNEQLK